MQMKNMSGMKMPMQMGQNQGQPIMNCPLFAGIPREQAPVLMKLLNIVPRTYEKDEHIVNLGENLDMLGIVVEGEVGASFYDEKGAGIIVRVVSKGGIFADSASLLSIPSMVQVVALAQCRVAWVETKALFGASHAGANAVFLSKIAMNFTEILARRNMFLNMRTQILAQHNIRHKLKVYLRLLSVEQGCIDSDAPFVLKLPFNKTELASFLGVNRSALSRELGHLHDEGLLKIQGDRAQVLNNSFLNY